MAEKKVGTVTLVGAGPGHPGLLTLAGKRELERAEVVLYDRLAGEDILTFAAPAAELVDVGKESGAHPRPQEEINRLLLHYAGQGKRVVRLKGGDPFLFGRGGEELEALRKEGIPFQMIPGVSSALAAPAYAGIPVTHRSVTSSLHIITGHGKPGKGEPIPYGHLAALQGTLVFLMGVRTLPEICSGLLSAGMKANTPAALVENGTLPNQRRILSTLEEIPETAAVNGISPPAVLVVGEVCRLADKLEWAQQLPLWGKRILVAGASSTGERLSAGLSALGCIAPVIPCVHCEELPFQQAIWENIQRYGWIVLTSPYGVERFFEQMRHTGTDIRQVAKAKFAAIGKQTAKIMRDYLIHPDLIPQIHDGRHLAEALARQARAGEVMLLFRAENGSPDLPEELRKRGIPFEDIAGYRASANREENERLTLWVQQGRIDGIAFTSASAVEGFSETVSSEHTRGMQAVCIGRSTAEAARKKGYAVLQCQEASLESMEKTIVQLWGRRGGEKDANDQTPPQIAESRRDPPHGTGDPPDSGCSDFTVLCKRGAGNPRRDSQFAGAGEV